MSLEERRIASSKKLRLFNGRWGPGNKQHAYIAAKSMTDAARIAQQAQGPALFSMYELSKYWVKDCWGSAMAGIEIERGLWIQDPGEKPRRVI